jgi:DNA-directed RNA polymerase specialized sigma24 family protein
VPASQSVARFDIACELILNFLRGEEEQSQREISRRTGVPLQTVSRHIRDVWAHVAELLGRWREAG